MLHVEDGGHRLEEIFPRSIHVIDEGLRQVGVGVARRAALESAVDRRASLTLLSRKMPASTGVQVRKLTSQRGVMPPSGRGLGGVGELPGSRIADARLARRG